MLVKFFKICVSHFPVNLRGTGKRELVAVPAFWSTESSAKPHAAPVKRACAVPTAGTILNDERPIDFLFEPSEVR